MTVLVLVKAFGFADFVSYIQSVEYDPVTASVHQLTFMESFDGDCSEPSAGLSQTLVAPCPQSTRTLMEQQVAARQGREAMWTLQKCRR